MIRRLALTLAAAGLAVAAAMPALAQQAPAAPGAAPAAPPLPTMRLRGTLDSLTGDTLAMTTRTGEKLTIQLQPNWMVRATIQVKLDEIKNGDFVGASAIKGADGKLVAEAIHYLGQDQATRDRAQGDIPWDLTPQSLMVNADVGTIVKAANGALSVKMTHKNATYEMAIAPNTPVVKYEPGDKALLVKGAWLFFTATKQANGTLTATTVTAETKGVKPPL
jgi:hypothetical protein